MRVLALNPDFQGNRRSEPHCSTILINYAEKIESLRGYRARRSVWTHPGGSGTMLPSRKVIECEHPGDLLLANHKSAIKRIRSNERKRQRNRVWRSRTRTEIKKARKFIESNSLEEARKATLEAIRTLDKAANKGVLHPNNAARRKSRLMKRLAEFENQS